MALRTMTRRTFAKLAAATGIAATIGTTAVGGTALAEGEPNEATSGPSAFVPAAAVAARWNAACG